MNEWLDELATLTAAGEASVIVTVADVRGSAPREAGAKMIVTQNESIGTIGGGQLEHQCTRLAVDLLQSDKGAVIRSFPLGSAMGQCCGGVVDVLFEPVAAETPSWLGQLRTLHEQRTPATLITGLGHQHEKFIVTAEEMAGLNYERLSDDLLDRARELLTSSVRAQRIADHLLEAIVDCDFNIAVFGAGHVGTAVVTALSQLDCSIRWIDSRRNIFAYTAPNVRTIEATEPAREVAALPRASLFLVMTHSHALDFEICDRILRRADMAYCGLIGSRTKRRRFERRFRQMGLAQSAINRLTCPIGVHGIQSKKPAEIAVATAADLLRAYELGKSASNDTTSDNVRSLRR